METDLEFPDEGLLPFRFQFYYDLEHGWLEVPYSAIVKLQLTKQISNTSHQIGDLVYLEEGLDAVLFTRSFLKNIKKPGDYYHFNSLCSTVYDGEASPIRKLPCYDNRTRNVCLEI